MEKQRKHHMASIADFSSYTIKHHNSFHAQYGNVQSMTMITDATLNPTGGNSSYPLEYVNIPPKEMESSDTDHLYEEIRLPLYENSSAYLYEELHTKMETTMQIPTGDVHCWEHVEIPNTFIESGIYRQGIRRTTDESPDSVHNSWKSICKHVISDNIRRFSSISKSCKKHFSRILRRKRVNDMEGMCKSEHLYDHLCPPLTTHIIDDNSDGWI